MNLSEPSVKDLSDSDLIQKVERLRGQERATLAELVAALAEVERRSLYLREGFPSLYVYCTDHLELSEHEAYIRMQVARAALAYPKIIDMLSDGRLTLTAAALLAKHLNVENHEALLEAAVHRTKRQVLEQLAALHPQPAVASTIWQVTTVVPPNTEPLDPGKDVSIEKMESAPGEVTTAVVAAREAFERSAFTPLAPNRYKMQVTLSREAYEMFRRIQALSRHTVPSGDPAILIERSLQSHLGELERRRCAQSERLHQFTPCSSGSRYVPAHVRRTVWRRDNGQCAFVGTTGRCPERGFLEFHHVVPYSEGGATTVANMELRCRAHNAFEAEALIDTG
jgi:hypothetical protein